MAKNRIPPRWPQRLWLVRHGESAGNLARDAAHLGGASVIDIAERDADVPLSPRGAEQARALAAWFAEMAQAERPEAVLCSPYLRARQTGEIIRAQGGLQRPDLQLDADERLREREFGILDRLTSSGVKARFPEQAEAKARLGKFYHRAPGGESWCDVILRLRSALDTLSLHHAGENVLVICHQVVVLCIRYLLEELDEAQILAIDAEADVANCGVTEYVFDPAANALKLIRYNYVAPLSRSDAPVTTAPDHPGGAR